MPRTTCRFLATVVSVLLCTIPVWGGPGEDPKLNRVAERQLPKIKKNIPQPNAIKFDCNNAQRLLLSSFLAGLDPDEASTILVSGTCTDNLHITGINRLTLLGAPGAILQGDTIQNNVGRGVSALNAANVTLAGETIQNSGAAGVGAFYGTNLNVQFSVINSNGGAGGIRVAEHSTLRLIDSTLQGNPNGVSLESSSLGTFENFGLGSIITGNGNVGVQVADQSFGDFSGGPNTITGNLSGTDVVCVGQFPVTLSAKTLIGGTTNCAN